jgi:plastocyanin
MRALAILAAALFAACGSAPKPETSGAKEAAPVYFKADPATAGRITGKVMFTGARPPVRNIDMSGEEVECRRLHGAALPAEDVVINADGSLANVFVWVSAGLEDKKFELPAQPAEFDQRGCMFRPHVLGVRAGQPFLVSNSDPVTHNVHPMPQNNREWNQGQPPGAGKVERTFHRPEICIPVKCNVHSWMKAYICVVDHPYFAVTAGKGEFALDSVPPGAYTVSAFHEKFGILEQKVTLAPSGLAEAAFAFSAK